jgi:hypothetical protein
MFVRVILELFPLIIILPGLRVTTHEPAGREFRTTLPVATTHVGCVMFPKTGDAGTTGWGLMVTFPDDTDVQPVELVTVNVYVPDEMAETVVVIPVPVVVAPPGFLVIVQVPVAGKPFNITLPVARVHVG